MKKLYKYFFVSGAVLPILLAFTTIMNAKNIMDQITSDYDNEKWNALYKELAPKIIIEKNDLKVPGKVYTYLATSLYELGHPGLSINLAVRGLGNPNVKDKLSIVKFINDRFEDSKSVPHHIIPEIVHFNWVDINSSNASGIYYYLGSLFFRHKKLDQANNYFMQIAKSSRFYNEGLLYQAIIANLQHKNRDGISLLEKMVSPGNSLPRRMVNLVRINIARFYFEENEFLKSLENYGKVEEHSEFWMDSLFESSWVFFKISKPNSSLGNLQTIQSPFYNNLYYPEGFVLKSLNYLKNCMVEKGKSSVNSGEKWIQTWSTEINQALKDTDYQGRINFVTKEKWRDFHIPGIAKLYKSMAARDLEIIQFDENKDKNKNKASVAFSEVLLKSYYDLEIKQLYFELVKSAAKIKSELKGLYSNLQLVKAELLLGKLNTIKKDLKLNVVQVHDNFIGGMKPLIVGQRLEFWPFEGEYWEDELGYYVYNYNSECE